MLLGLIGCGRMGKALVLGAIDAGAVEPSGVIVFDVQPSAMEALRQQRPVELASSVDELARRADVLLLCTKPVDVSGVLREIAACPSEARPLLISVAAGVTLETFQRALLDRARVIRAMPNTPALIRRGAAAFARGPKATDADAALAARLLGAVGSVVEVPEYLLDAVTGLSGSGPAYAYLFIEALADGGVANGLPREQALQLAVQTVLGAAAMVQSTGDHPAVLRDMVTSPAGTTAAGLRALESRAFRSACLEAVTAATKRSRELGAPTVHEPPPKNPSSEPSRSRQPHAERE